MYHNRQYIQIFYFGNLKTFGKKGRSVNNTNAYKNNVLLLNEKSPRKLMHCLYDKDKRQRKLALTLLLDICRKKTSHKFLERVVHDIFTSLQMYPEVDYINAGFFVVEELPLNIVFKRKLINLVLSKKDQLFEQAQHNAILSFVQKMEG